MSKRFKILFLVPPARSWAGELLPLSSPHIGVAYLCAYLKMRDVDVAVMDLSHDYPQRTRRIKEAIGLHAPDLVGITVYSNVVNECREIVADVRGVTSVPIVAGGPHISVSGGEFLRETGAEYGIIRDGEVPLHRLIEALRIDCRAPSLSQISGLLYQDAAGTLISTENRDLIVDLDEIPFPDWSVFDLPRYFEWAHKGYPIITSRGCPYGCTYCAAPLVTGRKFRFRSASNVVREMQLYAGKGFERFGIADDAFNVSAPA